jgi:hypothetical protein
MKRDRLNTELQALERKIRLLLSQHLGVKKQLENLQHENLELRALIGQKERQMEDFKNKIKISTIVDSISVEDEEASEVRNKIDEYIKEIDRCIHQLAK